MDEKAQKSLRLVTFWLFGSALIISAAWVGYMAIWISAARAAAGTPTSDSPVGAIFGASWAVVLVTLAAAVVLWLGYRYWYLPRNAGK